MSAFTLADIKFLQTKIGARLLAHLADQDLSPNKLLPLITKLRADFEQEQVRAAISMAQLRQQAVDKFGDAADRLFFTDSGLQQASDRQIRQYRAQNVSGMRILDVCCGIGTDSIAFAKAGAIVDGIDYDPVRVTIAQHNATSLDLDIQFEVADATQLNPVGYDLIFFDPARRDDTGKRIYHVEQYIPPLHIIQNWDTPQIVVKMSPGVDLDQLRSYQAGVEFISVEGDLKEAVLHKPAHYQRIATRIDDGKVSQLISDDHHPDVPLAEPNGWLCEPDPAILRANLVQDIANEFEGTMLDETIAFFCTNHQTDSIWLRAWKIREWMPFNLKKLRKRLREMDVGTLTVKKRGSPITPEDLIRKLKLKGNTSATVVLTRYDEQPIAIICDDILPV